MRGIRIATVYRTIKDLLGEGWLAQVDLPGQASRYEVAESAAHHHHSIAASVTASTISMGARAASIVSRPGDSGSSAMISSCTVSARPA